VRNLKVKVCPFIEPKLTFLLVKDYTLVGSLYIKASHQILKVNQQLEYVTKP